MVAASVVGTPDSGVEVAVGGVVTASKGVRIAFVFDSSSLGPGGVWTQTVVLASSKSVGNCAGDNVCAWGCAFA